jgi:cellulose synthase/poly-beta-1,6-N-acetylglucosamine synthase-like glycosyltransferase
MVLHFITCLLVSLYLLYVIIATTGWMKVPRLPSRSASVCNAQPDITILVCFRDEEQHMPALIKGLLQQDYPDEKIELLLVNDHTSDQSVTMAEQLLSESTVPYRVLHLDENQHGKKAALELGVQQASYHLILCTDADTIVPVSWIKTMVYAQTKYSGAYLWFGPVDVQQPNFYFNRFHQLELSSLITTSAGFAAWGHPVFCNGANMMFRKDIFLTCEDPLNRSIASGDDVFLIHALKKLGATKIKFVKSHNAIVRTKPSSTIREFMNQRIRWAAKSKYYRDAVTLIMAYVIALFNIMVVFQLIHGILTGQLTTFIYIFMLKMLADFFVLLPASNILQIQKSLPWYPIMQLIYPWYALLVSVGSMFPGVIYWKNRRVCH